jgi:hypothetical protein
MKMEKIKADTVAAENNSGNDKTINLPGYPSYPADEDIYNNFKEETDVNPEDITKKKIDNETEASESAKKRGHNTEKTGGDLDVPGSELDDTLEDIGNEDEENNYYSIGGDAHLDLDENQNKQ